MQQLLEMADQDIVKMVRAFALLHAGDAVPRDAHLILFADGSGGIQSTGMRGDRRVTLHHNDWFDGASWHESSADASRALRPRPQRHEDGRRLYAFSGSVRGSIPLHRVPQVRRRLVMYTQSVVETAPDRYDIHFRWSEVSIERGLELVTWHAP